ncbi:unnamed protein product [Allacma fusca]|uniref:DNA mismatch repair protein S5 domain-containing protein n=1 Tax=Allacma fusca TaxID=39272 RepID=A0A8J2PC68_9HEXA|nr:unnamed protein product [Allacma fusca]
MSGNQPRKIRKLDPTVVNRIAAGEVIQRPSNAIKELMENSLDAGAGSIQISVKSGGLKLLQIQDDGCGINKEDLEIVCERFTTSKLSKFEDLEEIGTYGFRGEALASISHVAHLRIITKTADSVCAYQAEYIDGRLKVIPGVTNPKPCAGNKGTIITAEDLFYNMDIRRRALKAPSEEHNRIVDVVTRYAVHNSKVGFSVKKAGEGNVDMRTPPKSTAVDNIRVLYGGQIARELLEVKHEDEHFKMRGHVTNVNFSTKKFTFLLFINHRLVESAAIRKAVDAVYTSYLPKGSHPFLYLSIEMNPRNVDVNVHPTKNEVHFLHEDLIISATGMADKTAGQGGSSTLKGQGLKFTNEASQSKSRSKDLIPLDKFLTPTPQDKSDGKAIDSGFDANSNISSIDPDIRTRNTFLPNSKGLHGSNSRNIASTSANSTSDSEARRRQMRLKSVKDLCKKLEDDCHKELLEIIRGHIFVGCVDRTRALIQHETKLYMINTTKLSSELFYQKILWEFGNLGRIVVNDPVTIHDLIIIAFDMKNQDETPLDERERRAAEIHALLMSKSDMLDDYFGLKFDSNGRLRTLPLLLENYFPCFDGLPTYLLNIAEKVNWSSEKLCFSTFAHETSLFYAIPPGNENENEVVTPNNNSWKWTIEHVVYPEAKKCLLPPKVFAEDCTFMQLANLPDLYKVFERC